MLDIVTTREPAGGRQERQQPGGQGEVAQVVHAHVQLEPVGGQAPVDRHQAGVVGQHVEPGLAGQPGGELLHRRQAGQVERPDLEGGRSPPVARKVGGGRLSGVGLVPAGHDHPGAPPARYRVTSRPRPRLAPVTTATRPDRSGTSGPTSPTPSSALSARPHLCPTGGLAGHSGSDRDIWEEIPEAVSKLLPSCLREACSCTRSSLARPGTGGAVCGRMVRLDLAAGLALTVDGAARRGGLRRVAAGDRRRAGGAHRPGAAT